jgi:hypothetical protein
MPQPAKKGPNGCLIALAIVGGIILVIGLAIGFVAYRFATSPDGKKIVSAVASGATLALKAQNAPGAAELRAHLCKGAAMVVDGDDLVSLAEALGDGAAPAPVPADERIQVFCTPAHDPAPTCNEVAATYVAAVGGRAAGPFVVAVGVNGEDTSCRVKYTATGASAR